MATRSARRSWLLTVVLLLATACGAPDSEGPASWQGEVVRIPAAALEALDSTTPEVEFVIDGDDETEGPLLTVIADVALTSDGRVLILEGREQAVHLYGPTGEFLRTIGGRGEGPGEFTRAIILAVVGDTVAVWESSARLHTFTLDGTHLTTDRLESGRADERWTGITDLSGSERGLFVTRYTMPPGASGPVPITKLRPYREIILMQRLSLATSAFDSLFTFSGRYYPVVKRSGPSVELFGAHAPYSVATDGVVARIPSGDFAVEWLDESGAVVRTVVSEVERRPVTEEDFERAASTSASEFPPQMREQYEEALRDSPVAEYHPSIGELFADGSGRVLVLRFDIGSVVEIATRRPTPRTWDYLTDEGELLGRFVIPSDDRPVLLQDGYLYAIRTSPLGVPSLAVYNLLGARR